MNTETKYQRRPEDAEASEFEKSAKFDEFSIVVGWFSILNGDDKGFAGSMLVPISNYLHGATMFSHGVDFIDDMIFLKENVEARIES